MSRLMAGFFLVVAVVVVGVWVVGFYEQNAGLFKDPTQLAYFVADLVLTLPLTVGAAIALWKKASWAPLRVLMAVGAGGYAGLHFGVYLIKTQQGALRGRFLPALIGLGLIMFTRCAYWAWHQIQPMSGENGRGSAPIGALSIRIKSLPTELPSLDQATPRTPASPAAGPAREGDPGSSTGPTST